MKNVAIVGFGRFGKTLYRLLKDDFTLTLYDNEKGVIDDFEIDTSHKFTTELEEVYESEVVFLAVPITKFEEIISSHSEYFTNQLLIDVLSVKKYPERILSKVIEGTNVRAMLTHPMFGPDSSKDGFEGLPIVVDQFSATTQEYKVWKNFFESKELRVIEMSADRHDRLAANSQGVAHFIGRVLDEFGLESTEIDTNGAKSLKNLVDLTCNDTWELFVGLQNYNPYTSEMRRKIGNAYDTISMKIVPERVNNKKLQVGIQGGKGSFNEEAARYYLNRSGIDDFELVYLYTTENVLKALKDGEIDKGQFAIHNSTGGVVKESIEAMAKYRFEIIEEVGIKISHALMCHKDSKLSDISKIMTHPQVLKQCKKNLSEKYRDLELTSGEGDLIDHANVASAIADGSIPSNIATMGSKILAEIYDLNIIEENLQDLSENFTSFLWVKRIG